MEDLIDLSRLAFPPRRRSLRAISDRLLEYTGASLGVAGALLLAMNVSASAWGWVLFLASNGAWLLFAARNRHFGMLSMQAVFTATSLLGIWRGLLS